VDLDRELVRLLLEEIDDDAPFLVGEGFFIGMT